MFVCSSDSEPTEPLSVDGNSSELEMEDLDEDEVERKNETFIPQTPDHEAFLKTHFGNLTDLGSPGRVNMSHRRFLSFVYSQLKLFFCLTKCSKLYCSSTKC